MLEKLLLRPLLAFALKLLYRVEVRGLEHYASAGKRVLIVCNHQSFLDPMILAVFSPQKPAFAMNVFQAQKWYFRPLARLFDVYKIDPLQPMSTKGLIQELRKNRNVVIFPEGRITTTGGIMKIYDGAGLIAEKAQATILPVRIDGAQYSRFSRMHGKLRLRWFPRITLTFLPPVAFEEEQGIPSKDRRKLTARKLYDLMCDSAFITSGYRDSILAKLVEAYARHGGGHGVASDIARKRISYRSLFARAFALAGKIGSMTQGQRNVGVLLPGSLAGAVTFVALHMARRTPAMLNFSVGAQSIRHACHIAQVQTVLTSRGFVEKGKFEPLVETLIAQGCHVAYLEDMRSAIALHHRLKAAVLALWPKLALRATLAASRPDDPAVILYTSGSEGLPKGVVLSHANILANIYQAIARLDLTPADVVFNALPIFHSFGLTIGMLMPLVTGVRTFLYPSPVHYRVIADLCYDVDATVMLGTDTFYAGYARYAHPYDFHSVRLAVAGAEKLKPETRRAYAEKFGVSIMEGYGVTEASPAIAFNTRMDHKQGSVGRPFPRIECRLEPVAGIEQGGRLFIKGPNVMLGYLKADQAGVIQPQGEWYDTGDIVEIDAEGFITILGRVKRFAKIGGEMVSLQAVEDMAGAAMPEAAHAAIALPDPRKGEQVLLASESSALTRELLLAYGRKNGVAELFIPRKVVYVVALPRLGTGKIDYPRLAALVCGMGEDGSADEADA